MDGAVGEGGTTFSPPPAGLDHWAVTGLLQLCGVTILLALGLTLWGLLKRQRPINAG